MMQQKKAASPAASAVAALPIAEAADSNHICQKDNATPDDVGILSVLPLQRRCCSSNDNTVNDDDVDIIRIKNNKDSSSRRNRRTADDCRQVQRRINNEVSMQQGHTGTATEFAADKSNCASASSECSIVQSATEVAGRKSSSITSNYSCYSTYFLEPIFYIRLLFATLYAAITHNFCFPPLFTKAARNFAKPANRSVIYTPAAKTAKAPASDSTPEIVAVSPNAVSGRVQLLEPFGKDGRPADFHWTSQPVSHPLRRRAILQAHPEIEQLYGSDWREAIFSIAVLMLNLFVGFYIILWQDIGWLVLLLLTCCVSGTLNHTLFLSMHEACHTALFSTKRLNEIYVLFSNLSMGVPAGISFLRYHMDHHVYMGVDVLDPDIPTDLEARCLGSSPLGKFIFVLLLPYTYTLRPMLRRAKKPVPLETLNWIIVLLWDLVLWKVLGARGLIYFVGGTLFSLSLHPLNGHLIAEHYQFPMGEVLQETYSTYDRLGNLLTFNAGYHLEHHDFPRVPGFRLPRLHAIAKEFYEPLPHHCSWFRVICNFIFDPRVSPFSRVKRVAPRGGPIPPPHTLFAIEEEKKRNYQRVELPAAQNGATAMTKGCAFAGGKLNPSSRSAIRYDAGVSLEHIDDNARGAAGTASENYTEASAGSDSASGTVKKARKDVGDRSLGTSVELEERQMQMQEKSGRRLGFYWQIVRGVYVRDSNPRGIDCTARFPVRSAGSR